MFRRGLVIGICFVAMACLLPSLSFTRNNKPQNAYEELYFKRLLTLEESLKAIIDEADNNNIPIEKLKISLKEKIHAVRLDLKSCDFWLRYLEPVAYKKLNAPLPVEWETEVFEKFEKPYRRDGGGLTLAELFLDDEHFTLDSFQKIIVPAIDILKVYRSDSIITRLREPGTFYFANRLFLLNLASIYSTGFECPDTNRVIPEIIDMASNIRAIYESFYELRPDSNINKQKRGIKIYFGYLKGLQFNFYNFDRLVLIDFIKTSYKLNARSICAFNLKSHNFNDYTIDNQCMNLLDKNIYSGQNKMGLFAAVKKEEDLAEIRRIGKLLFYDPILSGNNKRSCASCHKSEQFFTDTAFATSMSFDGKTRLKRNTPSLLNVVQNHLLMLDGKHLNLQDQAIGVITNPEEMGGTEKEVLVKILSCKEYKKAFEKFVKWVPGKPKISMRHVVSAITVYAGGFNRSVSIFDALIMSSYSEQILADKSIIKGFNLFMGKAQCGTCHFFPTFSGVKPPFVSSEFEVIGTPEDRNSKALSPDKGRFIIHPVKEMEFAFRTPTLRNLAGTKPYMHNGVFSTLSEVIDFYDAAGAVGHGLKLSNQTLSGDSLHLSVSEKSDLLAFLNSLNENYVPEGIPVKLPKSRKKDLNARKVGGEY